MNNSKFLSKVMGIYFVIISIAMVLNMTHFIGVVEQLINNAPLMFVVGFVALILGLLLTISHNIWHWNWTVIITIISWLTLLKGINILIYPNVLNEFTVMLLKNPTALYIAATLDFILGLFLSYFGFKK